MNINEKIDQIRHAMKEKNIVAVIIPSDDPHGSEYVAEHWQERKWVTGFSGSAGTAVITQKDANLWVDFRYYIQAESQIKNSYFKLFKLGEPKVPTFQKWLEESLESGDTIGLNGRHFSTADIKKFKSAFKAKEIGLDTKINIVKPFESLELSARITAIFNRIDRSLVQKKQTFNNIEINYIKRQVTIRDEIVKLTKTEFQLLELLVSHPNKSLSREFIEKQIWWDSQLYSHSRALDVHIQRLRKKIEEQPENPTLIITISGVGYKFNPQ